MSPILTAHLPIEPMVCPRPRVGHGRAYMPSKYVSWKRDAAMLLKTAMASNRIELIELETDIQVRVQFRFGRDAGIVLEVSEMERNGRPRGDLDNYLKAISDAMNGIVYADDRQIARIEAERVRG